VTGIAGEPAAAAQPAAVQPATARAAAAQAGTARSAAGVGVAEPAAAEGGEAEPGSRTDPAARSRVRTTLRLVIVIAASVAGYFALRGRMPSVNDIIATVRGADARWVAVAIAAEVTSIAMFAAQQRELLSAFGVRISVLRALAVTYSRSAIAVALPAGSAVSAGFAFQQYRQRGATRATATTVTILSALASTVGLALLYLGGSVTLTTQWLSHQWAEHHGLILVCVLAVVLFAVGLVATWSLRNAQHGAVASARQLIARQIRAHRHARRRGATSAAAAERDEASRAWWAWARRLLVPLTEALRGARAVPARHWAGTLAYALANWLLDLICLIAVARACHLDLGLPHLAAAYLAVQIVRQVPITPGGIGLIETSLLAGLVSAGAAQAPAAAVVLGYRLLSCWLVIPVGLLTWLGLRLPHAAGAPGPAASGHTGIPVPREQRRSAPGPRALRPRYGRRLARLRSSGPGGVRRPRQRQPH